jgi:DNA-binding response OmpR family regulator
MANKLPRILIVDDEPQILRFLRTGLPPHGYDCVEAMDAVSALAAAAKEKPDVIVLDLGLPDRDGLAVIEELRKTSLIPIVVLSARDDVEGKVKALELGADDYITKPFDSEVLLLKIKAILKRNDDLNKEADNKEFEMGSYHFNPKLRELGHKGQTQTLSPKENELLKMLAEHMNDLLPREQALKKIWGSDTYFNGRSMDVYIAKLRKYLKDDSNIEIVNIHGNGFRLVVPVSA